MSEKERDQKELNRREVLKQFKKWSAVVGGLALGAGAASLMGTGTGCDSGGYSDYSEYVKYTKSSYSDYHKP